MARSLCVTYTFYCEGSDKIKDDIIHQCVSVTLYCSAAYTHTCIPVLFVSIACKEIFVDHNSKVWSRSRVHFSAVTANRHGGVKMRLHFLLQITTNNHLKHWNRPEICTETIIRSEVINYSTPSAFCSHVVAAHRRFDYPYCLEMRQMSVTVFSAIPSHQSSSRWINNNRNGATKGTALDFPQKRWNSLRRRMRKTGHDQCGIQLHSAADAFQ